jgi:hypothetical protein
MIRASFIPPRPIRELRALTRRRKQLVRAGAQERNRVQKEMEECNIKLGNVLSDVFGLSGQLMQEALVEGTPGRRAGTIGTDEQGTTGALARAIRLPGNKLLDTFCLFATLPTTNDCTRRSKRHRASRALRIKHD